MLAHKLLSALGRSFYSGAFRCLCRKGHFAAQILHPIGKWISFEAYQEGAASSGVGFLASGKATNKEGIPGSFLYMSFGTISLMCRRIDCSYANYDAGYSS